MCFLLHAWRCLSGEIPRNGDLTPMRVLSSRTARQNYGECRMRNALLWLFFCSSQLLYAQSLQPPPPSNMKVLGLIGGTSWYSTVAYYEYLNRAVNDAYRNNTNPPLILYNMNQQKIHDLQAANDWEGIAACIRKRPGGSVQVALRESCFALTLLTKSMPTSHET
jgi:hypothetical protein